MNKVMMNYYDISSLYALRNTQDNQKSEITKNKERAEFNRKNIELAAQNKPL